MATRKHAALAGTRVDGFLMDPNELVIVGLDTEDGPEHPLYDPKIKRALNEPRVLNVMRYGVKKNVVVRKNGDRAEVVDGRTRTRWAREASKRLRERGEEPIRVPVSVVRCDDEEAHDLMVCLNEVREDEDPIERAKKLERLKSRGRSDAEVAVVFGIAEKTVKSSLSLLDLNADVQRRVASGELGLGETARLAKIPREKQTKAAEDRVAARDRGERPSPLPGERPRRPKKREVLGLADYLGGITRDALRWSLGESYERGPLDRALEAAVERMAKAPR